MAYWTGILPGMLVGYDAVGNPSEPCVARIVTLNQATGEADLAITPAPGGDPTTPTTLLAVPYGPAGTPGTYHTDNYISQ